MLERGARRTHARIEAGLSVQRAQADTASQGAALPAREGRVISEALNVVHAAASIGGCVLVVAR